MKIITKKGAIRSAVMVGGAAGVTLLAWLLLLRMPGASYAGPAPVLNAEERVVAKQLEGDVRHLAETIGPRAFEDAATLSSAGQWVESRLEASGYEVTRQEYEIGERTATNYIAELAGSGDAGEIVVVGAHYDTMFGPGADDNASGVAVLLALANAMKATAPSRTLRFVAFTNEEPPSFWTEDMGSLVYARSLKAKDENVVAMLSLETVGYYSDAAKSQNYPRPFSLFYPSTGNFVGFVGNLRSRALTRRVVRTFRGTARIPSEGAALPGSVNVFGRPIGLQGIDWSDHWSFWQVGYPAVMVTDTAVFRNPWYHHANDKPDTLDYERMALVTEGLEDVLRDLGEVPAGR